MLGDTLGFLNFLLDLKVFFLSIEKDFLPSDEIDDVSIFFVRFDEIVRVFFYLFP